MGSIELPAREWVVRFSSVPLVFLAGMVFTGILGRTWLVGLLWGPMFAVTAVVSWRPFRLSTSESGARIEYLTGFHWLHLSASEVVTLRYEHALGDLRGRALLRADLADGRTVAIAGTSGRYWFRRSPTIPTASIPRRRFHLVSTVAMLSIIQQRFGMTIDTYDAIAMNPRR